MLAAQHIKKPQLTMHQLTPLQVMVDEAIEFLREHEPPEGYTLADSFGKDSTVILELAQMAGVKFVHIHNRTGIDPPELIKFGQRTRENPRYLIPKMSFWDGLRKRFPPTVLQRWCCDVLKHSNGKRLGLPPLVIVGVRGEESPKRRSRPRFDVAPFGVQVKPIFHWTSWHVWEFIEGLGLPYCELYDQGFDRIGCCVCPMITSKNMGKINQHRARWPGFYKAFEHAVTHWFYHRAWWDRHKFKTPDRFLQAWYRSFK